MSEKVRNNRFLMEPKILKRLLIIFLMTSCLVLEMAWMVAF